jgi:RimJ/RimL family protein N-acetyltransferase
MLVFGHDKVVAEWVMDRIPDGSVAPDTTAIGVADGDKLIAGVAYTDHTEGDVRMAVAAETGSRWLSKANLEVFFGHVFYPPPMGMGKRRATVVVHQRNKMARAFDERLGFNMEGKHPKAFPRDNAISYGMLAENCRWVKQDVIRKR